MLAGSPGRGLTWSSGGIVGAIGGPNRAVGYRPLQKVLHWVIAAGLAVQLLLGLGVDRSDGWFDALERVLPGDPEGWVMASHVGLGVTLFVLVVLRLAVRRRFGLPPWASQLSARERRLVHRLEQVLYAAMLAAPATGLILFLLAGESLPFAGSRWDAPGDLVDDDVALGLHVLSQLVLVAAVAVHLVIVGRHQLLRRDGLARRMWWNRSGRSG